MLRFGLCMFLADFLMLSQTLRTYVYISLSLLIIIKVYILNLHFYQVSRFLSNYNSVFSDVRTNTNKPAR